MTRYVVSGGYIYVTPEKVAELYGLERSEWVTDVNGVSEHQAPMFLFPREDWDYDLQKERKKRDHG